MVQARCEECNKEFGSEESLNQHNNAKHPGHEKPKNRLTNKQKRSIRNWSIFIILFIVTVGGIASLVINSKNSLSAISQGPYADMSFQEVCIKTGGMWMKMQPTQNYAPTGQPACYGCMQRNGDHICDKNRYLKTLPA